MSELITQEDSWLDYQWLELGNVNQLDYQNRLLDTKWDDEEQLVENITELCRDPNYLHFICKYILNVDLLPYQTAILQMLWTKPLPMFIGSRGAAKSFILSVYAVLRALLHQGCKIAVVGAALRQSMVLFNYTQQIWENAPILRDIVGPKYHPKRDIHMCFWNCGDSRITYLPLGTGEKIRGQRANVIIADEFSSISSEIFETVVRGFAAVKSYGVLNNVIEAYKIKALEAEGIDLSASVEEVQEKFSKVPTILDDNQIILSGTAYYQFNHFYKYFKYYQAIIESGGDPERIPADYKDMPFSDKIDATKYCIVRIPYEALPPGLMDETILTQGKATMDEQIFNMEYGACFPSDSEGFYLASWLEKATCPVKDHSGEILFNPRLVGDRQKQYIMGIDPASEDDNFALTILEINENFAGIVYTWTTNRKDFEERRKRVDGGINEEIKDYNTFCIKHIRDLRRRFNVEMIVLDTGGGGLSVREGLKDPDKLLDSSDELVYDMEDEESLGLKGSHSLKMIEFSSSQWRKDAHWGLRKDILDMNLIFPFYDPADVAIIEYEESVLGRTFDTLEDCYLEIQYCKQETTLIKHSQTPGGTEKWDVPKIVGVDAEQVRKTLKRDRFTSLLLANWGYRLFKEEAEVESKNAPTYSVGSVSELARSKKFGGQRKYTGTGADSIPGMHSEIVGNNIALHRNDGGGVYF